MPGLFLPDNAVRTLSDGRVGERCGLLERSAGHRTPFQRSDEGKALAHAATLHVVGWLLPRATSATKIHYGGYSPAMSYEAT